MISLVINCDSRVGYKNEVSTVGDFGQGSLQGVRSTDLLTHGVQQKINFFRGYDIQVILYIDRHEDISQDVMDEIESTVHACSNNSKIIFKENDRTKYKWNDRIYYVCHMDGDANCYRTDECDIVDRYVDWLDTYKYVCQPWDGVGNEMYHASTRFFICKRETLESAFKTDLLANPYMGKHSPCLEFALGYHAGEGNVLYPQREDENYIVFSWARYYQGTLAMLNKMHPSDVLEYIIKGLGIHGANDCLDEKPPEI